MAWFEPEILDFFADLEWNNNRPWFELNKKRYERYVKQPMEGFAAEIIKRMQAIDPNISMTAKQAVFRIYRDVRFSKDKLPYKTNAGLYVSAGGRDHHGVTGIYFHVDAKIMAIASGYYSPTPPQIRAIRNYIAANLDEFAELLELPEFMNLFGTIAGERSKVLPAEFKDTAKLQPLLYQKQFHYWAEFDGNKVVSDDLPDLVIQHYQAARPMNAFLTKGIQSLATEESF